MASTKTLAPHHAALIAASGIHNDVAEARGYRTVMTKAELRRLGFSDRQASTPALMLPVHDVAGNNPFAQIRPDTPRIRDGKPLKYETPAGVRMTLDVPPAARLRLGNPAVPLIITEGIRKADAAVSHNLCAADVIGVWNWRGTNEHGGKVALSDLEYIAFNGRSVFVVYDSDVMLKPSVRSACERLAAVIRQRGADIWFVLLPSLPDGAKQGLDDYLAAGHGFDDLQALAQRKLPVSPAEDTLAVPYRVTQGGLVWDQPTRDGIVTRPLTTFAARIVADVSVDDGVEVRREFEIEAALPGGPSRRFTVPASAFERLSWATEHLGARALVDPGMGTRDQARAAVQLLSGEIPQRRVFGHTGWRDIDGKRYYLHASGAIGAEGTRADVMVSLPLGLTGYRLPDPPAGEAQVTAIRASLGLLGIAPAHITWPLLAAIYRAANGPVDLSLHLAGPTGAGKTAVAALYQQHYGPTLDARHLPGSWDSTANALEALAFVAKDTLFTVDDFMPNARGADAQRLHRDAERLLRAVGNQSGRARMRADTTLRPPRPPRSLLLSTGEDIPRGQSLRARTLVLELGPDDLDWSRVSVCQEDADAGLYAAALAGFVQWLAATYPDTTGTSALLRADVVQLRSRAAGSGLHRRTPEIVANLAAAVRLFLAYATEAGALTATEAAAHWQAAWVALGTVAQAQGTHQATSEPASRFLELLSAVLASGLAHLAAADGGPPPTAEAWGWRRATVGTGEYQRDEWRPQGRRVGWIDGQAVYLDRDSAHAAARTLSDAGGELFTITRDTLGKRLAEQRYLASMEAGELTVRRVLEGKRRRVWCLTSSALYPAEQPGQSGHEHTVDAAWPDSESGSLVRRQESGHHRGQGDPHADAKTTSDGRIGRVPATTADVGTDESRHSGYAGLILSRAGGNPATQPATALPIQRTCVDCGAPCGSALRCSACAAAGVRRRA